MATIKSALVLNDQMSRVLRAITGAMDNLVTSFEKVEKATDNSFDPNGLNEVRQGIGLASAQLDEMEEKYRKIAEQQERNSQGQDKHNRKIKEGVSLADSLESKIKGMVGAYLGVQTLKKAVDLSDELVMNKARIDMMNDSLQSTDSLMNAIFASAQRARGDFSTMTQAVAKIGNNVGVGNDKIFKTAREVVRFTELIQKQMKLSGTSSTEAANAMTQLTQALGSGVLRGQDLNSVLSQAPGIVQRIADYMGEDKGKIKELAAEGKITADIVKNAMFSAAGDIEKAFDNVPMTWGDVFTQGKNLALKALEPLLKKINEIANMDEMQKVIDGVTTGMVSIGKVMGGMLEVGAKVFGFLVKNWSWISVLIGGAGAALLLYKVATAASTAVEWISVSAKIAKAIATKAETVALGEETVATNAAAMAQWGLNSAILACPVTWIVAGLLMIIAVLVAVCSHVAKTSDTFTSTLGIIVGAVFAAGAFILNFVIGLLNAIISAYYSMFVNPIKGVIEWVVNAFFGGFDSIGSACANLIGQMINMFIGFAKIVTPIIDAVFGSDLTGKLSNLQSKVSSWGKNDNSFSLDMSIPQIERISYGSAFEKGYSIGEKWQNKLSDKFGFSFDDYFDNNDLLGKIEGNTGSAADSAGKAADSLSKTTEELEWLRDIAEKEAINRFTTAEVKIDMTGMTNQISGDMDLDGVISALTEGFVSSLSTAAEGVY